MWACVRQWARRVPTRCASAGCCDETRRAAAHDEIFISALPAMSAEERVPGRSAVRCAEG